MGEIRRVVVMEDDPDARALIRASLVGEGFEVREAPDGAAGLELIRRDPPDLALIDYLLPDLDGLEVCRRIGADPATEHVPRILLTGKRDLDPDEIRSAGATGTIAKPFRPDRLGPRIREVLG